MHRLLSSGWVPSWKGWEDAAWGLREFEDDEAERAHVIYDCTARFCSITVDNVVIAGKSDEERKAELREAGKYVGEGLVFDCNACLMDSLLQTMAEKGLIDGSLAEHSHESTKRRRHLLCRRKEFPPF